MRFSQMYRILMFLYNKMKQKKLFLRGSKVHQFSFFVTDWSITDADDTMQRRDGK